MQNKDKTMTKISKVKSVQGNGTWNGKDGTLFYRYDYEMEDGTSLQASHKEQDRFKAGDEVEYEITRTHETYGNSGKVKKPNDYKKPSGVGDLLGIKVGHALNCASVIIANKSYKTGAEFEAALKATAKVVFRVSEELNQELSSGTKPAPSKPQQAPPPTEDELIPEPQDADVPF